MYICVWMRVLASSAITRKVRTIILSVKDNAREIELDQSVTIINFFVNFKARRAFFFSFSVLEYPLRSGFFFICVMVKIISDLFMYLKDSWITLLKTFDLFFIFFNLFKFKLNLDFVLVIYPSLAKVKLRIIE